MSERYVDGGGNIPVRSGGSGWNATQRELEILELRKEIAALKTAASQGSAGDERNQVIEECARNLEQSYPGHAWLNAACAATRSLLSPPVKTGGEAETKWDHGEHEGCGVDSQRAFAVDKVARAIAEQGFGRAWDDFLPVNAHDTDHGDLTEYAQAAVDAILALPKLTAVGEKIEALANRLREAAYFCTQLPDLEKHCREIADELIRHLAQEVKDPILTPRHFLDDVLAACDASNWDADRNKGDYYRGLNDAYETILNIAVEYQTSIYAWCKRGATSVPSAHRGGEA